MSQFSKKIVFPSLNKQTSLLLRKTARISLKRDKPAQRESAAYWKQSWNYFLKSQKKESKNQNGIVTAGNWTPLEIIYFIIRYSYSSYQQHHWQHQRTHWQKGQIDTKGHCGCDPAQAYLCEQVGAVLDKPPNLILSFEIQAFLIGVIYRIVQSLFDKEKRDSENAHDHSHTQGHAVDQGQQHNEKQVYHHSFFYLQLKSEQLVFALSIVIMLIINVLLHAEPAE